MSQQDVINYLKGKEYLSSRQISEGCKCTYNNTTRAIKKLKEQGDLRFKEAVINGKCTYIYKLRQSKRGKE